MSVAPPTSTRFPKRIIIARHGESKGNISSGAYVTTPDWLIPLSRTGAAQSKQLGARLRGIVQDEDCYFYTSPYLRTKQTLATVLSGGDFSASQIVGIREEPRLTEQQFGNFQNVAEISAAKNTRIKYGRFYYRFPEGESGLDVYNRCSSFVNTLHRDFEDPDVLRDDDDGNVIMMTHGLTMRLLIMRFFHYNVSDFERSENSRNCGLVVLERREDWRSLPPASVKLSRVFRMTRESRKLINFPKAGHVNYADMVSEVSREGLTSFAEPAEHIKYWTDKTRVKWKTPF